MRDVEPVAKAGLLEPQVALDVVELFGERHVGAPIAEQVAGELGEIDQQLARLLGVGMDVARDRGERVVDEMGRDLRSKRPELGLGEPLLLLAHNRQLDLRRDQARGLLYDAQLIRTWAADRPVEGDQRPGALALDRQRRQHGRAQGAVGVRRDQPRHDVHAVVGRSLEQPRQQIAGADLLAPFAVDRQHRVRVGQRDRRGAGERAQMRDGVGRRARVQTATEVREGGGGGMQRRLHAGCLGRPVRRGRAHTRQATTRAAASAVPSRAPSARFI